MNRKVFPVQNGRRQRNPWQLVQYAMVLVGLVLVMRIGFSSPQSLSVSVQDKIVSSSSGDSLRTEQVMEKALIDAIEKNDDSDDDGSGLGREKWHVFVLGWKRYKSLQRLLKSLSKADYLGERVALHVCIDGGSGSDWEKSIEVAKKFKWKFGSKEVRVSDKNRGLAHAWLSAWIPASDDEHAIILEDDLTVSPMYFKWMKLMWENYGDRPEIGGVTLQRQRLVATNANYRTIRQYDRPFAYKLLGSWGFSPSPKHWREFLKLEFETMDASVPGLVTTKWWSRQKRGKMWTQYWIWYCNKHDVYNIYQTCPNRKTFATNWREKGVHYGKSKGADFKTLDAEEWVQAWNNPPEEIDLYSFGLKKVGVSRKPAASSSDGSFDVVSGDELSDSAVVEPSFSNNNNGDDDDDDANQQVRQVEVVIEEEAAQDQRPDVQVEILNEESNNNEEEEGPLSDQELEELSSSSSNDDVEDDTSSVGTEQDTTALVSKAKTISKDGIMFLQLLNAGFVEMTKAWICNVQHIPRVLDRTLFICTDQAAYDQMLEFVRTSGIHLNLHLQIHKAPKQLRYGQLSYYQFILYRSSILISLLKNDIPLFLIESDATWFGDPVKYLMDKVDDDLDIVLMHNDYRKTSKNMNGGFIWFKNTKKSLGVVRKLYNVFKVKLARLARAGEKNVGGAGNEQQYFQALIFRPKVNSGAANIKAKLVDIDLFAPGLWYNKRYVKEGLSPLIILNNWIRGNDAKRVRAQKWGTWFLNEDGATCQNTRVPSAADVAIDSEWNLAQLLQLAKQVKHEVGGKPFVNIQTVDLQSIDLTKNAICNMKDFPTVLESTVFICTDEPSYNDLQKFGASMGLALRIYMETNYDQNKAAFFRAGLIYKLVREGMSVLFSKSTAALLSDPLPYLETLESSVDIASSEVESGKKITAARVAFFKNTGTTKKFLEKFVVGAQKAFLMNGKATADESKFIKPVNLAPLAFKTLSDAEPFSKSNNAKKPWGLWNSASDTDAKLASAKSIGFWLLAVDKQRCRVD